MYTHTYMYFVSVAVTCIVCAAASNQGEKTTAPSTVFTIVQQKQLNNTKTVCLALDTSGSMSVSRCVAPMDRNVFTPIKYESSYMM